MIEINVFPRERPMTLIVPESPCYTPQRVPLLLILSKISVPPSALVFLYRAYPLTTTSYMCNEHA